MKTINSELTRIRDFSRVIHAINHACPRFRRGCVFTEDDDLVTCKYCLNKMEKRINKAAFLQIENINLEFRFGSFKATKG